MTTYHEKSVYRGREVHLLQWKQKNKNKLSLVLTIGVVLSWIYQLSLLFAQRKRIQAHPF